MNFIHAAVALAVSILCCTPLHAQGTPPRALLALSKSDRTLAIVDPATLQVVARVAVGPDPHEVIASADGKTAYVSNYGGGAYNTLAVVDLVAQKALPVVDLGPLRGPHGLIFVGGKAWFTAEAAKVIGRYDPVTHQVDWILGTGQDRTHMIFVFDDQKRILTTNVSSGTLSIIEKSANDWHQTLVSVGSGSEGFDVSPARTEVWVANAHEGTIAVVRGHRPEDPGVERPHRGGPATRRSGLGQPLATWGGEPHPVGTAVPTQHRPQAPVLVARRRRDYKNLLDRSAFCGVSPQHGERHEGCV